MLIAKNIPHKLETSIFKPRFQNIQQVRHWMDDVFIINIHAVLYSISRETLYSLSLFLHSIIYHRIEIFPFLTVQIVFICIEFWEIII